DAHKGCKAGENRGVMDGVSHDHRFMEGMPGMGLMKSGLSSTTHVGAAASTNHGAMMMNDTTSSTRSGTARSGAARSGAARNESDKAPNAASFNPTELMWMPKMGWMNMSQCHHCSMPLPGNGEEKSTSWQSSTVSAEGWTMRVRCALCARDMSAETKGGAILSLSTEDPNQRVTVFSDEEGNLSTEFKGAVFLEEKAGHPRCSQWSQAFTSKAAFEAYVKKNPKYDGAKMLTFDQWAAVEADETPETYVKESGPVENPYAEDLKVRGIQTQTASSGAQSDGDAEDK
ncbi:MAG TPA: hypothetical protein VM821_06295, partial [Abditibacteriaceae bacterium]|nr:hypothetical protein [Abditibacteriaceae bacterium]